MGFVRGAIVFVLGFLLLISFLAMNLFLTLTLSLSYENVQPQLGSVVRNSLDKLNISDRIDKSYPEMVTYCKNNSDYIFNDQQTDLTFIIPCSAVTEGKDKVIDEAINSILEEAYYKDYECSFFQCFNQKDPSFLVSKFAQDYWRSKFYSVLFISLILIGLLFFFISKKLSTFTTTGVLLIISALPFAKSNIISSFLNSFFSAFIGTISDQPMINSLIKVIFSIFLSQSYRIFIIIFSLGVVITGIGYGLKLWKFEEKFFSSKDNGNNLEKIKEEIKEKVKEELTGKSKKKK